MATSFHSDTKSQTDAAPKALLLGLVLVPTRLIPLLQAMLDLHRLLLRVLHAIIPPEVGLIKMRDIGGSKHRNNLFELGVVSVILCEFEKLYLGSQRLVLS